MEFPTDLKDLESNQLPIVEAAKKKFHEHFNCTKEAWLLNGLVEHYLGTGSVRCAEVLACVREPHDSHFFNKMTDGLRNHPGSRLSYLTLLSHVIVRQPPWLYKIAQHSLFKELLKILKVETDMLNLMSALLILIILLPMVPAYVGNTLHEIFEVFSRLAAWNTNNPNKLYAEQLVHLQISLQFLFHRLYGMYPCNFLSYLRQQYGAREHLAVFSHTIKPMLETVKMHPLLVTTSKETETTTTRWMTMEHHDVVAECAKLSIDSKDEYSVSTVNNLRGMSESEIRRFVESAGYQELKAVHSQKMEIKDLGSPLATTGTVSGLDSKSESTTAPTSIPHTPIPQSYVVDSSFPHQIGTSPPEAAVEATPETTPVKDPRLYHNRPSPINPNVVRALNHLGTPASPTRPPSQPSSPMKKEFSPFRLPEPNQDSKLIQRKVQSIMLDRLNIQSDSKDGVNGVKKLDDSPEALQDDQEDMEVLEISQQGEMRLSSNSQSVRQCDSVLQDFHPPHSADDLELCEQESGSPCPAGGLHMPNSHSMLTFRQNVHNRLRYYSQCGGDYQRPGELVSDPPTEGVTIPTFVRRAHSCPEIKKERPSFTGSGDENLDETLELETETVTTGTQTSATEQGLTPLYPYEHMFLALYPSLSTYPADCEHRNCQRESPTAVLDQYIEFASKLATEKKTVLGYESELKTAKDQLVLLHLQLKFERHRRESHAERNRRLLGKSRKNYWLEEHNSALRDQLTLLERDIDDLRNDQRKILEDHSRRDKKMSDEVDFWQDKSTNLDTQNREYKAENERLVKKLKENAEKVTSITKRLDHVEAMLFAVGKELKEVLVEASAGEMLRGQVAYLHKELMVMGEQVSRLKVHLSKVTTDSDQEERLFEDCYHEQVRSLNSELEAKTSTCEGLKARVTELETALARKDMVAADMKRFLKSVKEECREKLEAVETKYQSQVTTNRKLECHIMELNSKVEAFSRRSRRNVSAAQDVLSLAERGGMNSPLSLSLSSSEGLSLSSTLTTTDAVLPRDLQAVVDAPEVNRIIEMPEFDDIPGPSGE